MTEENSGAKETATDDGARASDKPAEAPAKKGGAMRWVKRVALAFTAVVALLLLVGGGYGYSQTSAYDESVNKVYDIPVPKVARSTDPEVIARGKHLAGSIGGCAMKDCHGPDLSGGKVTEAGPIGTMVSPNISVIVATYSDGEVARLIRHGVKKDGRTARFMPCEEINWLPDSDVQAIISWVRTMPPVDKTTGTTVIKPLGKILDRKGMIPIDTARRINHDKVEIGPPPTATKEYGSYIARLCSGCHGEHMSGGPIPGAPSTMAVPKNLTPHATGLAGWTYADFEKVSKTGINKEGKKLDDFMPVEALGGMDDTERHALFAYLQSLPPAPFGGR